MSKLTLPVVYALVVAAVIGFLLHRTPTGRRLYAVGFNRDAARLAGIRTDRLRVGALLCSSLLAGATGIVLAASVGSGSTTNGTPYLLPAFAGVFLGATQIRPGRFNAWGTVLAVLLLGTLTTGFSLAGVSQWIQQLVAGLVLVVALMVAGRGALRTGLGRRREAARRHRSAVLTGDSRHPTAVLARSTQDHPTKGTLMHPSEVRTSRRSSRARWLGRRWS